MVAITIEDNLFRANADYAELAVGHWRELLPFLSFQVVVFLVDEVIIP